MIEISPMAPHDLGAVVEIERSSHLEPWSEWAFRSELDNECSYVRVARLIPSSEDPEEGRLTPCRASTALSGGTGSGALIVGYICFWVIVDEIQVLNVTVQKNHRGKGYGKALLLHALQLGFRLGARKAFLEVRDSNVAAKALYHRIGFVRVGERADYYGVLKEPALLMELRLDEAWQLDWLVDKRPFI